ncbi:MAG: UDP-2,3-diacylglucosamine diphosphatase [Lysobacterales bacterium]
MSPAETSAATFISDLHLGSTNCHAEALCDFLAHVRTEKLYLVGDVVDLWWISARRARFDRHQHQVLQQLHRLARVGTELIYIPGNHDRPLRDLCGLVLPRMTVRRQAIHRAADGRRYLVTHGDDFDAHVQRGDWQEWLGDRLYDYILAGNRLTHQMRQRLGLRYWSLADFIKRQSSQAERYIARFREAALRAAAARGLAGVICGHIHRPALEQIDGLIYANDGDWVESMTALREGPNGQLALLRWTGRHELLAEMQAAPLLLAA